MASGPFNFMQELSILYEELIVQKKNYYYICDKINILILTYFNVFVVKLKHVLFHLYF